MASSKLPKTTVIKTTDMHTGGHPLRIIESGIPEPEGKTNAEKRAWLQTCADHYRKFVMLEPRGHRDMFGVILVTPDLPEADLGLIFIHNGGYSPMCGHGVIALGRYAIDKGLVVGQSPETAITLQCPCGPVTAYVTYHDGVTSDVRFNNVPCYVFALGVGLSLPGMSKAVTVDIVWGGAFYAFVTTSELGLNLNTATSSQLVHLFHAIKEAVNHSVSLHQPDHPDLAFLYGVLFTVAPQSVDDTPDTQLFTHTCVFGQNQLDRSPCGSGTSARVALEYHRGVLPLGKKGRFRNGFTGSEFKGSVVKEVELQGVGPTKNSVMGVVTEVSGHAHYSGSSTFIVEEDDRLAGGFSVS